MIGKIRSGALSQAAQGAGARSQTRIDLYRVAAAQDEHPLGVVSLGLLDVEGDSATLGKTAGKDVAQAKATFPALIGADASRARLEVLAATMRDALAPFPGIAELDLLARKVIERDH